MKIAYIIHAYKLPKQLERLVGSLLTENSYFFIHIDKKVNIKPFEETLKKYSSRVIFVNREYSNWGTILCVKGVLNAITTALNHTEYFEYFYCLSGQDYPIKSKEYIEHFFKENKNVNFIKYFPLPYSGWKGGGTHRYNRYHFIISKNRYIRRLVNVTNFFLPRRNIPYGLKPFGGEFYFGLNRGSVEYIDNFIKNHPLYIPFFKYTYIPEELFFQTILLNNSKIDTKNETLTYINWNRPKGPYPAILNNSDFNNLLIAKQLFARKFDMQIDSEILECIDNKILKS